MAIDKLTSQALASGSVTSDAIATGAITVADIPDGEISAAKLHTTAITDKLGYTPVSPTTLSDGLALKANASSLATVATSGSASDLITGILPSNRIAGGTPITFATGVSTTEVSLGSSANVWYDAFTITLTTKRANSILIVNALLSVDRAGGNYPAIQTRIHAYKNGVSAGVIQTLQYSEYEGNVQEHHIGRSPIQGWHTSVAVGDVWTYYIQAANQSGSTPSGTYAGYVNRYGSSTGFAMEIAV